MAVESYGDAVLSAARETGLDEKSFTSEMPWALADSCATISSSTDTLTMTNRTQ